MSKNTTLAAIAAAALLATLGAGTASAAENPFAESLKATGAMQVAGSEGKCGGKEGGEGKCGGKEGGGEEGTGTGGSGDDKGKCGGKEGGAG